MLWGRGRHLLDKKGPGPLQGQAAIEGVSLKYLSTIICFPQYLFTLATRLPVEYLCCMRYVSENLLSSAFLNEAAERGEKRGRRQFLCHFFDLLSYNCPRTFVVTAGSYLAAKKL